MKFDVSKIYTAVNADKLKVGDKVIVADCLDSLKREVELGVHVHQLKGILDEVNVYRFVTKGYPYNLAYLVERKKEKKFHPYKEKSKEE